MRYFEVMFGRRGYLPDDNGQMYEAETFEDFCEALHTEIENASIDYGYFESIMSSLKIKDYTDQEEFSRDYVTVMKAEAAQIAEEIWNDYTAFGAYGHSLYISREYKNPSFDYYMTVKEMTEDEYEVNKELVW